MRCIYDKAKKPIRQTAGEYNKMKGPGQLHKLDSFVELVYYSS